MGGKLRRGIGVALWFGAAAHAENPPDPRVHSAARDADAAVAKQSCPVGLGEQLMQDRSSGLMPRAAAICGNGSTTGITQPGRLEELFADNPRTTLPKYPKGYLYRCLLNDENLSGAGDEAKMQYVANFYYLHNTVANETAKSILARAQLNRLMGKRADFGVKVPEREADPKAYQAYQHVKLAGDKCGKSGDPLKRTALQGFVALQQYAVLEVAKEKTTGEERKKVEALQAAVQTAFPWLRSADLSDVVASAVAETRADRPLDEAIYLAKIRPSLVLATVKNLGALDDRDRTLETTRGCVLAQSAECFTDPAVRAFLADAEPFLDFRQARKTALGLAQNPHLGHETRLRQAQLADGYEELGPVPCRLQIRNENATGNGIAKKFALDVGITVATAGVGAWANLAKAGASASVAARAGVAGKVAGALRSPAGLQIAAGMAASLNVEGFGAASLNTYRECVGGQSNHFASKLALSDNDACTESPLDANLMAVEESRSCGLAVLGNAVAALPFAGGAVPKIAAQLRKLTPTKTAAPVAAAVETVVLRDGTRIEVPLLREGSGTITQQAYDLADTLRKKVPKDEIDEVARKVDELRAKHPTNIETMPGMNGHYLREAAERLKGSLQHRKLDELSSADYAATQELGAQTFVDMMSKGYLDLNPAQTKATTEFFDQINNFYASPTLPKVPDGLPSGITETLQKFRDAIKPLHDTRFPSTGSAAVVAAPAAATATPKTPLRPVPSAPLKIKSYSQASADPRRGFTTEAYELGVDHIGNPQYIAEIAQRRDAIAKAVNEAMDASDAAMAKGNRARAMAEMNKAQPLIAEQQYYEEALEVLTGLPGYLGTKMKGIEESLRRSHPERADEMIAAIRRFREANPAMVAEFGERHFPNGN